MSIYLLVFILYILYYISIYCFDRFKKDYKLKYIHEEYKTLIIKNKNSSNTNVDISTDNLVTRNVNIVKTVSDVEKIENVLIDCTSQVKYIDSLDTSIANINNHIDTHLHNLNCEDIDEDLILEELYTEEDYTENLTYTLDEIFNQEKELFQSFSQNKIAMLANLLESSIVSNQENDQDPVLTDFINQMESLTAIDLTDDSAINNHLHKIADERNIIPSDL